MRLQHLQLIGLEDYDMDTFPITPMVQDLERFLGQMGVSFSWDQNTLTVGLLAFSMQSVNTEMKQRIVSAALKESLV